MPQKLFSVFLLSIFWFAILLTNAFAQTNFCAVKMEVSRYESESLIKNASARAVNTETKKVYLSKLKNGIPYFARLPEGVYRVTVTKAGFRRSEDIFYLHCAGLEGEDYEWSIELYQGSSKKLVKLYNVTVVGDYDSDAVNPSPATGIGSEPINSGEAEMPPVASKVIAGGGLNGKAISLVIPPYPPAAGAARASGAVNVQVTVDEGGNVISASAVSGHALLRGAAESAARASKFSPTILSGQPVKVTGVVVYYFTLPEPKKDN
jgi:TonB family protein